MKEGTITDAVIEKMKYPPENGDKTGRDADYRFH
jgi:hypothetical protein